MIFLTNRSACMSFLTLLVIANGAPTRKAHKNNRDVSEAVQLSTIAEDDKAVGSSSS